MVALFHDMMQKEIKAYVDDMIAKSIEGENHFQILKELFERLSTSWGLTMHGVHSGWNLGSCWDLWWVTKG